LAWRKQKKIAVLSRAQPELHILLRNKKKEIEQIKMLKK